MKRHLTQVEITSALVFFPGLLLVAQNPSMAIQQSGLVPTQAQPFYRDLVHSNYQDFFQQGIEKLEREIQRLNQRQDASTKPLLTINLNPQVELERLPQLQPPPSHYRVPK